MHLEASLQIAKSALLYSFLPIKLLLLHPHLLLELNFMESNRKNGLALTSVTLLRVAVLGRTEMPLCRFQRSAIWPGVLPSFLAISTISGRSTMRGAPGTFMQMKSQRQMQMTSISPAQPSVQLKANIRTIIDMDQRISSNKGAQMHSDLIAVSDVLEFRWKFYNERILSMASACNQGVIVTHLASQWTPG